MNEECNARHHVTALLVRWRTGDRDALDQLVPLVYDQLRRLARAQLARVGGATVQPTELISEAYMNLIDADAVDFADRSHFFSMAALTMRRVLVDRYRRRNAERHGGGRTLLSLDTVRGVDLNAPGPTVPLDQLDDALTELERLDPRQARIVVLRFFGGLTIGETGTVLGLSPTTVSREWALARRWLHRALRTEEA